MTKTTWIVLGVIAAAIVAYYLYQQNQAAPPPTAGVPKNSNVNAAGRPIATTL
jgi:hypothetical protein